MTRAALYMRVSTLDQHPETQLHDLRQMLFRPTPRLHSIPLAGHYICSSSTPPGGGVHGMCGYLAAKRALGSKVTLRH